MPDSTTMPILLVLIVASSSTTLALWIFLLRTWRALLSFLLSSFFFAANLASIAVISSLLSFYSGLL